MLKKLNASNFIQINLAIMDLWIHGETLTGKSLYSSHTSILGENTPLGS